MALPNPFDLRHHRSGPDGNLVEGFLATYDNRQTRRNYRTDLRQFFSEDNVTQSQASQIDEEDITVFLKQLVEDSLERSTLKRKLETIRSFFRWLAEQNFREELPIREEVDTGDLVDQVFKKVRETAEEEIDSRTVEGSARNDPGDSEHSHRGSLPRELEPGSEVNLGRETDSSPKESSSPSSRPGVSAGAEETPGSEHTESPSDETPSREKLKSGESSNDSSTGTDPVSAKEGPSQEESVEERDAREDLVGEGATEENSADEDSAGEDSDGKDRHGTPDWVVPSGNEQEIDLAYGRDVALADLPDALLGALRKLEEPVGPEGIFLRCTDDLAVRIQYRQHQESPLVEVTIKHRTLEHGGELLEGSDLYQAILYLARRGWALPPTVYDRVATLPDSVDAEGPFSEKRPRWSQENADNTMVRAALVGEVTGALAQGFGIAKDAEVFLGL